MKRLVILLIIIPWWAYSQDVDTLFKSKGITYSDVKNKTTFLKSGTKYIDQYDKDDKVFQVISTESFWNIMNLNVLEYFNLTNRYDTELKIKKYKETTDYYQKLDSIKKLKNELKSSIISTEFDYDALSDYDLDRNAFIIEIGDSEDYSNEIKNSKTRDEEDDYKEKFSFRPPNTIYNVSIEHLNNEKVVSKFGDYVSYNEIVLAYTNEDRALKIENHKSDTDVFLVCNLSSEKNKKIEKDWDRNFMKSDSKITTRIFYPSFIRLLMVNSNNGDIYFDKVYDPSGNVNMISLDDTVQKQELKQKENYEETGNALFPGANVNSDKNKQSKGDEALSKGDKSEQNIVKDTSEISYTLEGRSIEKMPEVNNQSQKTGKVVLEIKVDQEGNVLYAEYALKESTTQDAHLIKLAKEIAREATFNSDPNAPKGQWGKMSFTFRVE